MLGISAWLTIALIKPSCNGAFLHPAPGSRRREADPNHSGAAAARRLTVPGLGRIRPGLLFASGRSASLPRRLPTAGLRMQRNGSLIQRG